MTLWLPGFSVKGSERQESSHRKACLTWYLAMQDASCPVCGSLCMVGHPALAVIWVSPEIRFGVGGQACDGLGAEGLKTDHSLCSPGRRVAVGCSALRPWQPNDLPIPPTAAPPVRSWRSRADLAERRRIRSAIRSQERQELNARRRPWHKRLRAERQDNKENWL